MGWEQIQNSSVSITRKGCFIRFLKSIECDRRILRLPEDFITDYGSQIPKCVSLSLPNGEEYKGLYNADEKCIYHVEAFFDNYKCNTGMCLVAEYKGDQKFMVRMLCSKYDETKYLTGELKLNDNVCGIGSKFLMRVIGPIIRHGKADVPKGYIERFGAKIPGRLSLAVNSGECFDGFFSKKNQQIYGLRPMIKKKYINQFDILMFTYCGLGKFDVSIFGRGKVEKSIKLIRVVNVDQNVDMSGVGFIVKASASSVDGKSHGMYIPENIKPSQRDWIDKESILLRTNKGDLAVGLVLCGSRPRFSAGWNQFQRMIELKVNDKLSFTMMRDDTAGVSFQVEKL